jgi:uncharacterized protein with GYD domain
MLDVEDLANELVQAWLDIYAENGAKAFRDNERRRADIVARAREAGVYEAVYARANTLLHGN